MKKVFKTIVMIIFYFILFIGINHLAQYVVLSKIVLPKIGYINFIKNSGYITAGIYLVMILCVWPFIYKKKDDIKYRFKNNTGKNILLLILLSIPMYFAVIAFVSITGANKFSIFEQVGMMMMIKQSSIFGLVIGFCFAPGIVEEIFFRGLIYNQASKAFSITVSVIIQAVLFGAIHMNLFQISYAVILGVICWYIYFKTESIFMCMIFHTTYNFMSILFVRIIKINNEFISNNSAVILICSTVLIIAICLAIRQINTNKTITTPADALASE